jgi:hypothetical protein
MSTRPIPFPQTLEHSLTLGRIRVPPALRATSRPAARSTPDEPQWLADARRRAAARGALIRVFPDARLEIR